MRVGETLKEGVSGITTPLHHTHLLNLSCIVDYNSWQESDTGLRLAASLDKDVVLAEGMPRSIHNFVSCLSLMIKRLQGVQHKEKVPR